MTPTLGERLKNNWLAQGLTVRPAATTAAISLFEARHSVLLPKDLRDYLEVVNGTGCATNLDDRFFCFWSIEEFTSLSDEFPDAVCFEEPAACFVFADHSIHAPSYAIRLSKDPKAKTPILEIYSDNRQYRFRQIADSFSAFVEHYFANKPIL